MKEDIYIVAGKNGVRTTLYKNPPKLKAGEVTIKIRIKLPNNIFGRPIMEGKIEMSEKEAEEITTIKELEFELNKIKEDIE
jgi:hypothetical protein